MLPPELHTDDVTDEELERYEDFETCNGFAFWYVENVNENAIVMDTYFQGMQGHCYVYDPDLDVTIDPTLGQFSEKTAAGELPESGAWDGNEHPYDNGGEVLEWSSREDFEQHYENQEVNPYIV